MLEKDAVTAFGKFGRQSCHIFLRGLLRCLKACVLSKTETLKPSDLRVECPSTKTRIIALALSYQDHFALLILVLMIAVC